MDSKKRARTEDVEPPFSKKQALSSSHDSPVPANGTGHDTDEPKDEANLELFRKDAIYRRMKLYSRESEKNLHKIAELERRRDTCEAGLAALEACWTQLLTTIRSLVKPEELSSVHLSAHDVYDLTTHISSGADSQYVEQLRVKMQATEQLVVAFVKLSKQGGSKVTHDDTFKRCQEAQTECASLRSEISLLQAKLNSTQAEKEDYCERLLSAEKRLDRLQSKTVAAMNLHKDVKVEKSEAKDDSNQHTPSSPTPVQQPNGVNTVDAAEPNDWETLAKHREEEIEALHTRNLKYKQDNITLRIAAKRPTEPVIKETLYYQVLMAHASKLEQNISDSKEEILKLKAQVEQLTITRQLLEQAAYPDQEKAAQEFRNMIVKRDNENLRLREQRDQQAAELNERKHRDMNKLHSVAELKSLLDSRGERIQVLESELTRMKTRIAAHAEDRDLMTFFFKNSGEDISYVDDLKKRLVDAEERLKTFGDCGAKETEVRRQLAASKKQLDQYRSIFGDTLSTLPPDAKALSDQLKQKEAEVQRLQLLNQQHEQAESSLYTELEKLSAAWEALDRQVKSKVLDLSVMEEKLSKSSLEKAKAENKFYAAMRDKEAVDNERKSAIRAFEKQSQAVEKLIHVEKTLVARVAELERECSTWKHSAEGQSEHATRLEKENHEWKIRAAGERKRTDDSVVVIRKIENELHDKEAELRTLEENMIKSQKEAERQAAKMKSMSQHQTSTSSSREAELQTEVDKCMSILKCSTCRQNMRNTVLTKCMHSFCKNCVNERIASRQRKCPACNLPFSQGEVQQLYFQ